MNFDGAVPLEAAGVSVSFGGLRALSDVSLTVDAGEIVGLIGGNGAGKTTFMDAVSGFVQPSAGSIRAFGHELIGLPAEMRPYYSVARSFQHARLFPGLTVAETLLVAVERENPTGVFGAVFGLGSARRAERQKREKVDQLIGTTGLEPYRDKLVQELSTGTRRVLDIASILAQGPRLLLLDEPTAGLAQRETEAFAPLIQRVKEQLNCSVLIVEHDIVLISTVCDRVYALETGEVITSGTPEEVRTDPRVVASYLGTDEAAIRRSGTMAQRRAAPAAGRRWRRSGPRPPAGHTSP